MKIQVRFHQPKFSKKSLADYKRNKLQETRIDYLLWTLEPDFVFVSDSVFLTKGRKTSEKDEFKNLIEQRGKFNAEGLVNHIHLDHISRNPVWQFEIGIRAIRKWAKMLKTEDRVDTIVIYLNETHETSRRTNYTICLYSDPIKSELQSLESQWRREITHLTFNQFLKWTKKEYKKG